MKRYLLSELTPQKTQALLQGAIAPRPVCFASTVDKAGNVNLSPYSFFNIFSSNPPVVIFSPARRVRDNTTKHTLENVLETMEVVINLVSYDMVQQTSLASTEYPKGTNEFIKAGFTMEESELVKAPRVKEAPVQLECKVLQVIPLGTEGGAGNLVLAEVMLVHAHEDIFDANGIIDPHKIDLISRLGGDWYSRSKEGLFKVAKPLQTMGIGVDSIPESIKLSEVLTGNDLGILGNVEHLPDEAMQAAILEIPEIEELFVRYSNHEESLVFQVHKRAQEMLHKGEVQNAWALLLALENRI